MTFQGPEATPGRWDYSEEEEPLPGGRGGSLRKRGTLREVRGRGMLRGRRAIWGRRGTRSEEEEPLQGSGRRSELEGEEFYRCLLGKGIPNEKEL